MLLGRLIIVTWTLGDWRNLLKRFDPDKPWALIIGRPKSLNRFLRDYQSRTEELPYKIHGLIEYQGTHIGQTIQGLKVLGNLDSLGTVLDYLNKIQKQQPPYLVLTDQTTERSFIKKILRVSSGKKTQLIRYHPEQNGALSPFEVADLIGRMPASIDLKRAQTLVKEKTILITGAGGTIGSEITRQIIRLQPKKVILIDLSEFALYQINQEIESISSISWSIYLANIRDKQLIDHIIKTEQPDMIFHAAALKHVPLMENQPVEAVKTNIEGTMNVIDSALKHKVGSFILISTDKAVNPENIMGATKRFAELYTLSLSEKYKNFKASAVRFGNVLGSTGSVIPLFEKQISEGGPVTITHPDITRYFMTQEEAVSLVLQTVTLTDTEEKSTLYVLDMGKPISILHLARQLIRLRGFKPESDIKIRITGLRPGEKIYEEITFKTENISPSKIENIYKVKTYNIPFHLISKKAHGLLKLTSSEDQDKLVNMLFKLVQKDFESKEIQ